jgi:hypothetical protein
MATTTHQEKTIVLFDGQEIKIRPLKISLLREFLKTFEAIEEISEDNDKSMDELIKCVQIAFKQYKPELAEDAKALEDLLDLPTVYEIIGEASGNRLGDSSLLNNL